MAALHEVGVVHGDLKPDNVMLDCEGHVRILDVETAIVGWEAVGETERARVVHTPGYAAPEVVSGTDCTPASDVYSLGVMLQARVSSRGPACNVCGS